MLVVFTMLHSERNCISITCKGKYKVDRAAPLLFYMLCDIVHNILNILSISNLLLSNYNKYEFRCLKMKRKTIVELF